MIIYRRELKKSMKDELMRDERNYSFINKFIKILIDLNDKLYERA